MATLIHQHLCEDVTAISEARKNKRSFTIFPRQPPSALPVAGCSTPNAPTVVPPPDSLPSTALAPHQSTIPPDPAFNPVLPAIQSYVRPGYLTRFFDQNRRLPVGYASPPATRSPTPGPYQSGPGSPFLTPYRFVDCFARFLSTFVSPMPCSQPGHTVRLAIWQLLSLLVAPAKNFFPACTSCTASSCPRCRPNVASPKVAAPSMLTQCGLPCHVAERRLRSPLLTSPLLQPCACAVGAYGQLVSWNTPLSLLHFIQTTTPSRTTLINQHSQSISIFPIL